VSYGGIILRTVLYRKKAVLSINPGVFFGITEENIQICIDNMKRR